jgi:hypothetical protein
MHNIVFKNKNGKQKWNNINVHYGFAQKHALF